MKRVLLLTVLSVFFAAGSVTAQTADSAAAPKAFSADAGLDILSNYVWRGTTLDKGPCIQPSLFAGYHHLKLGLLGSYSLKHDFNNIILNLGYTFSTPVGDITPLVNDYYYPYESVKFDQYKGDSLSFSHLTEAGLQFQGTKLRLFASVNVHNDPRRSTYFEAGYKFDANGVEVEPFVGAVSRKSPEWMGADKAGLLNVGFKASKKIRLSSTWSLPLYAAASYHSQQRSFNMMAGISIF
ncbi:hypothetical protein V9K67_01870 [Paraflavisolibacter sp. H34]|uniref:hypothetical protein n=1 Tax=Huijunlia imazamoxiresistens TaxID=3127457 RepID=UPI0030192345